MKKIAIICAMLLTALGSLFSIPAAPVIAGGDCDGNAVIYCGIESRADLKNKVTNGTGKKYQTGKELTALFAKYNAHPSEFSSLKAGRVTNKNKVYVGDKEVASNVYTMGRHYIVGSTRISGLSYPLYKRHPAVSFLSKDLDAYVYLNYDGTMRYAVIKSCGNIVMGVVHNPPKPVTPTVKTVNLIINKFDDENGNKVQDADEGMLSDWEFKVSGPGFSRTVTTLPDGTVALSGLTAGTYTVTEVLKDNWENTTGLAITRNITTDPKTQLFVFGNKAINVPPNPETPETPTGGGDVKTLPVTGTVEWVLAGLVLILLASILWWVRSKDMLRTAKKGKPAVDPHHEAGKEVDKK